MANNAQLPQLPDFACGVNAIEMAQSMLGSTVRRRVFRLVGIYVLARRLARDHAWEEGHTQHYAVSSAQYSVQSVRAGRTS